MDNQSLFTVESSAFRNGGDIPAKYATTRVPGGQNISIPLSWKNAPEGSKSFVIAMVDRHQIASNWVHWIVINIPGDVDSIPEGASGTSQMPQGIKELINTFGSVGYGGPQPPPGSGAHDYETTVYALRVEAIDLTGAVCARELEGVLQGQTIDSTKIVGKYER